MSQVFKLEPENLDWILRQTCFLKQISIFAKPVI